MIALPVYPQSETLSTRRVHTIGGIFGQVDEFNRNIRAKLIMSQRSMRETGKQGQISHGRLLITFSDIEKPICGRLAQCSGLGL